MVGTHSLVTGKLPRCRRTCNENKKLAGSIASPANEIVACRYTIRKRRCLAPAAAAPGCTATCASYAYAYAWHAHPYPTNAAATTAATADAASAGSAACAAATTTASVEATASPEPPHPRQPPHLPHPRWASCTPLRTIFFVVEEMEGSEADVGKFLFTERDHHARSEIRPLLNVDRSVRPMPMRFLLAKKLIRRLPTPVLRFWLLASFSKLASPAAWSHPPTCCKKDIRGSDPTLTK